MTEQRRGRAYVGSRSGDEVAWREVDAEDSRMRVVHVYVPDHWADEPCRAAPEHRTPYCGDGATAAEAKLLDGFEQAVASLQESVASTERAIGVILQRDERIERMRELLRTIRKLHDDDLVRLPGTVLVRIDEALRPFTAEPDDDSLDAAECETC